MKKTKIVLKQQKVQCKDCGSIRYIQSKFADIGKQHMRNFARYALGLLKKMNIKDVAMHLGKSWTFVKNLQKEYLQKHYGKPKLKAVRYIGIDEVNIDKGHRYFTIVLDLESGEVLFVGDCKGIVTLKLFGSALRGLVQK